MEYVSIEGKKSSDIGLRVLSYSRPSYAEVRDMYTDSGGLEGSRYTPGLMGMYRFGVTFRCSFNGEEERVRKLEEISEWLYTTDLVEIVQSDMLDRYRLGKVENYVDFVPTPNRLEIDVEFVCMPYSIDKEGKSTITGIIDIENEYLDAGDLGTAASEFRMELELVTSVNGITVKVGSSELKINTKISSGDRLVIDTELFEVKSYNHGGGETNHVLDVYGEFPLLSRKESKIKLISTDYIGANVKVDYIKRYLI